MVPVNVPPHEVAKSYAVAASSNLVEIAVLPEVRLTQPCITAPFNEASKLVEPLPFASAMIRISVSFAAPGVANLYAKIDPLFAFVTEVDMPDTAVVASPVS